MLSTPVHDNIPPGMLSCYRYVIPAPRLINNVNIIYFRLFVKRGGYFQLRSHSCCALRVENHLRV